MRELVIIRIGILCDAPYILRQHVPKLAAAEGITPGECDALRNWRESRFFNSCERAVLDYTDAVTRAASASDEVFSAAKRFFDEAQIIELTVLIGSYNMHARVMNAVRLDLEEPDTP